MATLRTFPLVLGALVALSSLGQSKFPGFVAGNLVVSRSTYTGDAKTVVAGQFLPPICPVTASCSGKATDGGAFPTAGSTGNVWNNAKVDGSFGVTAPIFLDQMSPAGALLGTLAIPPSLVVASFASKTELAVNLSTDGSELTLMGLVAPLNALDVSNSNTPGVYDPTNPVGSSYYRGIVRISASGAMQVTVSNAYSGNNGRAAILANGLLYMAGNSNNGSSTPANVVAATGVQVAVPGQSPASAPRQVGNFSIVQVNDPSTGKPYTSDKLGKDGNYRGLTIFNNTLYVTKGSGSNGINTVYQVGSVGSLPTLANAATTPITILPGFPVTLARSTSSPPMYPFGIWFANATTLYVADEGDGSVANAASSATAGLQKWVLSNGAWQLAYVLQKGLNLGKPYTIANYPANLSPATGGLRNITGRVNADGTATLWAITSTVSANGDAGADPNQLVTVTDVIANTTLAGASNAAFSILKTAVAGEVLRGVAFTPTQASSLLDSPVVLSAANPGSATLAPGALALIQGQNLATNSSPVSLVVPQFTFQGTSVNITDEAGVSSPAALLSVSATQLMFLVPPGLGKGNATVRVTTPGGPQEVSNVPVANVAPGLFWMNNAGLVAAYAVRVSAGGTQTIQAVYSVDASGVITALPISMGSATDRVYLCMFGTGLQAAFGLATQATVGGIAVPVLYAGPQGTPGLDQVNVPLPIALAGRGSVNIQLSIGGIASNPVQVTVQ